MSSRLLLGTAVTAASVQLVVFPFLVFAFGWTSGSVFLVLALTMAGFAAGAAGLAGGRAVRLAAAAAAAFCLLMAVFFDFVAGSPSPMLAWVVLAGSLGLLLLPGLLFNLHMYGGPAPPAKAYQQANLAAAAACVLLTLILFRFGFRISFIGLSLAFSFFALNGTRGSGQRTALRFSGNELRTFSLSFLVAGFVTSYFELAHLSLLESGLIFPLYLFLTFLCLGLSPWRLWGSSEKALAAGFLCFILIFAFGSALFGIFPLCPGQECSGPQVSIRGAFILAFLLLPYIFFSALVPLRTAEAPGANHLFFSSLGNLAGFVFFSGLLGSMPFLLTIYLLLGGLALVFLAGGARVFAGVSALAVLLILWSDPLPIWIERGLQARMGAESSLLNSSPELRQLTRKAGATGFIADFGGPFGNYLGLGGYLSPFSRLHDQLGAVVTAELIPESGGKVLMLGLGSHSALASLRQVLDRSGRKEVEITVVDNFPPFRELAFRNAVASQAGFSWEDTARTEFRFMDAVSLLPTFAAASFDAVVWNLTLPQFGQFNRIYTKEFMEQIRRILAPDGIFVTGFYPDEKVLCLKTMVADHTYLVGRRVMVGTNRKMELPPVRQDCPSPPSFARPFFFSFLNADDFRRSQDSLRWSPAEALGPGLAGQLFTALQPHMSLSVVDAPAILDSALDVSTYAPAGREHLAAWLVWSRNPRGQLILTRPLPDSAFSGLEPPLGERVWTLYEVGSPDVRQLIPPPPPGVRAIRDPSFDLKLGAGDEDVLVPWNQAAASAAECKFVGIFREKYGLSPTFGSYAAHLVMEGKERLLPKTWMSLRELQGKPDLCQ
jgi:SAM-dependent methyltransferase